MVKNEGNRDFNTLELESLVAGTTPHVGKKFFAEFIRQLAETYGAKFAIVTELIDTDPVKVKTLAFWENGRLGKDFEYEVRTTPCECVYRDGLKYFPFNIQSLFAEDEDLVHMGVHSYFGIPLKSRSDNVIGHICILGEKPLVESEKAENYFKIFAARAANELERLQEEREVTQHRENLKKLVDEKSTLLDQAKKLVEHASRTKSEFLSRMTFELRIPMNSILGYASLLREGEDKLSPEQQKFIDNIIHAGWRLDNLISEMLDISLIEAGELKTNDVKCHVVDAVSECIKIFEPPAKQRGINIVCLYDTSAETYILADKDRLKQVLTNLLSNAVKFNRDKSLVRVKIVPVNNKIQISITDKGVGIEKDDLQKVFDKFERLDADESWVGGTGIGLAITKRLVEHMGGEIGVESEVGKGSTFWINFDPI